MNVIQLLPHWLRVRIYLRRIVLASKRLERGRDHSIVIHRGKRARFYATRERGWSEPLRWWDWLRIAHCRVWHRRKSLSIANPPSAGGKITEHMRCSPCNIAFDFERDYPPDTEYALWWSQNWPSGGKPYIKPEENVLYQQWKAENGR